MTTIAPTGRRESRAGVDHVVFTRTFRAPLEDVWAAVTEPARLERWIGTWTGDPASGTVEFAMTAEGEGVEPETVRIKVCEPPVRLVTESLVPGEGPRPTWVMDIELSHADGVTTLVFAQSLPDPAMAADIGPGWDYYLDRLVAAESGEAVSEVAWDDYYPGQSDHYREAFSRAT